MRGQGIKGVLGSLLVAAILSVATPLAAQPWGNSAPAGAASSNNGPVSLSTAIQKANQRYPGKVLSAKPATVNGRKLYKIKLLMGAGRLKVVFVSADNGKFVTPKKP